MEILRPAEKEKQAPTSKEVRQPTPKPDCMRLHLPVIRQPAFQMGMGMGLPNVSGCTEWQGIEYREHAEIQPCPPFLVNITARTRVIRYLVPAFGTDP